MNSHEMSDELKAALLLSHLLNTAIVDNHLLNIPQDFIGVLEERQAELDKQIKQREDYWKFQQEILEEWKNEYEEQQNNPRLE